MACIKEGYNIKEISLEFVYDQYYKWNHKDIYKCHDFKLIEELLDHFSDSPYDIIQHMKYFVLPGFGQFCDFLKKYLYYRII